MKTLRICVTWLGAAMVLATAGAGRAEAQEATPGNNDSGYVIAEAAPFRSRASDKKPAPGTTLTSIKAIGSPTEFVPRAFRIVADKDIKQVEMDAFSMTGPGKIDAANVDVSVLRWLPRGRNEAVQPEILVKDDREVLRGVFPTGPEFPAIRTTGPVKTEIKAGESKEFWVTFFIPEKTPPGTYKGALDITLDGKKRSIPCALEVLPIQLQKPDDVLWGIWFQIGWTDKDWSKLSDDERRKMNASFTFSQPVYEKYFKMTADCGFNIVSAPSWDSPAYGKIAELMKKYGMNAKYLFSYGCPWPYADKGQPENFTYKGMSLSEYTRQGVEFAKKNGYPVPLLGMEDENGDVPLQERRQAMIKPEGSSNWMCVNNGWEQLHKVMGYPMGNGGPWTRASAREAHRYGAAAGGYVQSWDPHPGAANGGSLKGIAGYGSWNRSADCYLHYTMLTFCGDPYNGTDGQYEDWNTIYCSKDGPIMTLRYAGHRAGVDDYRYVYTLVNLIVAKEQALAANPEKLNSLAMIRSDLDDVLIRNNYGGADTDKDRRTLADLIIKVQGM